MQKTLMTSVKLQKKLNQKMMQRIICDGYGMKGKSKWIIEAVEQFLLLPNYPELVDIADDMNELNEMASLRLTESLTCKIEKAIVQIRKHYPIMEGVKSNLIRASIVQRLIREPTSVTEV